MYSRVYLEIGNICNMNCSFCHGTKRKAKQLSFDEFKFIVDALKDTTKYLYFHVMGEPLLHPMLCEFIAYASEKGYKCAITTNGTLLPKRGDEIILPRNVHRSVINALVLCGAVPVYVNPEVDHRLGISLGMKLEQVELAIKEHPNAVAVLVKIGNR